MLNNKNANHSPPLKPIHEGKTVKLYNKFKTGDARFDRLITSFANKLSHMKYNDITKLNIFKSIHNAHSEIFNEARQISALHYGNYFGIKDISFTVNYKTAVILPHTFSSGYQFR
eukprot:TRINITY_DN16668_c0_g2_i1.p2 TRINITY_DN16668_c0_g2~~TRINITY_DN16668_c0_g2_i1.p2  ORF type:complete len:115 (-),score=13.06 TRINITY_DN16668_c0_g2_i1:261-605(-)